MTKAKRIPRRKIRNITRVVVMNPSKGLNNLVSPSLIDDREGSDMMNIEFDEGGVVRKRAGYVKSGNTLTAAKGLGSFINESVRYLITVDNGTLKYLSSGVWSTFAGSVSFSTTADPTFTQVRNKLYIWDGVNGGAECDGTTVSRPGTMPRAKFAIYYMGYHWAAGVDGQLNRLYRSVATDGSDFTNADGTGGVTWNTTEVPGATVFLGTGAQFYDVAKDDGDKITGLGKFKDTLILFKERSIWQITIDSTGSTTILPITNNTGCLSHRSIDSVENDLFFLSPQGLRTLGNEPNFFDAIRTNVLSIRVEPILDSITPLKFTKANAIYFDNKYLIGLPMNGSNTVNRVLMYDKRFGAFSQWDNMNANSWLTFRGTDNIENLYFLSEAGTQMYKWEPGTYADDGAAITSYWTSKALDLRNIDITKRFVDLRLVFRQLAGSINVTIYDDTGVSVVSRNIGNAGNSGFGRQTYGSTMLGQMGDTGTEVISNVDVPYSIPINANSRSLKFKVSNSSTNQNFVLLGYIVGLYSFGHYKFDSTRKIYG